ncbi:hypothetical protein Goe19_02130 [Bacillus phage vB_BsuM-Goe19]|nr:hypothetical protein Goe19_00170 [Bacillus phage vB_BsuM-Goe19]WCS68854.1 hypothetical protein Goe19_02130 [Bacillus phage vB_BsuM-Goe19]
MPYSKITVPVLVGEGLTEWDVIDVMRETHPPTVEDQYHYHTFDSMQNRTIFVLENPLYPDVDKIPEKVLEIAVDALEDMLDNVPVEDLPVTEEQGNIKRFTTKLASIVFDVFLIIPDFVSVTAKEE